MNYKSINIQVRWLPFILWIKLPWWVLTTFYVLRLHFISHHSKAQSKDLISFGIKILKSLWVLMIFLKSLYFVSLAFAIYPFHWSCSPSQLSIDSLSMKKSVLASPSYLHILSPPTVKTVCEPNQWGCGCSKGGEQVRLLCFNVLKTENYDLLMGSGCHLSICNLHGNWKQIPFWFNCLN